MCAASILLYAFAILCGAFSYIFVEFVSFQVLVRNSIVGLCAVSLPSAGVIPLLLWVGTRDTDVATDLFIVLSVVLSSAAYGFGGLIFDTPETGMSIPACFFGGLIFSALGFLLYSTIAGCVRARSVSDVESRGSNTPNSSVVAHQHEDVSSAYRVVQNPCESHIQIAVST